LTLLSCFSGTISRDEIRKVLSIAGEKIDDQELEEILKKVDKDGDGDISIEGTFSYISLALIDQHIST